MYRVTLCLGKRESAFQNQSTYQALDCRLASYPSPGVSNVLPHVSLA